SVVARPKSMERIPRCSEDFHNFGDFLCACGKLICRYCATGRHTSHFNFGELLANADRIEEEVKRMRVLSSFLQYEDKETSRKSDKLEADISKATHEIASKFTLIIAQAISRCLDLIAQTEKVGSMHKKLLNERRILIHNTLASITKATAYAQRCKSTLNVISRLTLQKSALMISGEVQAIEVSTETPQLKISFSSEVLSRIANHGDVITTNLIFDRANVQRVATFPTALVSTMLNDERRLDAFTRFNEALQERARRVRIDYTDPGLGVIGFATAPLVVLPPSPDNICILKANSTDPSDRAPRFELCCNRTMTGTVGLAAKTAAARAANVAARRSSLEQALPVSLRSWKTIRMDHVYTQKGSTESWASSKTGNESSEEVVRDYVVDYDQPGPSSPKRIKVEEEEIIGGSNHMENLMNFAEDCEKAVKYEDELAAFVDDEVKTEVDEDGGEGVGGAE
ncbi:hypothetical protein PFISCL1PPCAC_21526, partial [Pristionchus fissidentatus]